mgnify:CR=1 FL=1
MKSPPHTPRATSSPPPRRKPATEAVPRPAAATSEKYDGLRKLVADYDAEYNFSMGGGGVSTRKLDPVERQAKKIADDMIRADLAKKGRTIKQVPPAPTAEQSADKLTAEDLMK